MESLFCKEASLIILIMCAQRISKDILKEGSSKFIHYFFLRNLLQKFHKSVAQSVCVYMYVCVLKLFAQSTIIFEEVTMLDLSWQGISLSTRAIWISRNFCSAPGFNLAVYLFNFDITFVFFFSYSNLEFCIRGELQSFLFNCSEYE